VRFVMGWLRPVRHGKRCRVVIASDPPIGAQGQWLVTWFASWLDPAFPHPAGPGELRWRCVRADGSIAWVDGPGRHEICDRRMSGERFEPCKTRRLVLAAVPCEEERL
jgi:hypothetical protein